MNIKTIPILFLLIIMSYSCKDKKESFDHRILFLHHSTGRIIWEGGANSSIFHRGLHRISPKLANSIKSKPKLQRLFAKYNKNSELKVSIEETYFPKESPYGWENYPYDYYNIWVKHGDGETYMEEPTLEALTKDYQTIILKHCFPVSAILEDLDSVDINSDVKTLANYKAQYLALRDKFKEFPDTKFILFTGATLVQSQTTEEQALRAKEFFKWVVNEWDLPDDNIFIWDLYALQTEGGIYFKPEYALMLNDSHPNSDFAKSAVKLLFNRIVDIIENNGAGTKLTGIEK